jgi:hypothetical protein
MALTKDQIKFVVDSIMATDLFQFCRDLMQKESAGGPTVQQPATSKLTVARPDDPIVPKRRVMPSDRQIADETVEMVHNSRAAGAGHAIDYSEAREVVRAHYALGGPVHRYHRRRDPKLYRLEDSLEEMKTSVATLQHDGSSHAARERAERVMRYALENHVTYDDARQRLGVA